MNYKMVGRFMSLVIDYGKPVFMVPAWIVSLMHGEATSITAFAATIVGSILVGLLMFMLCRRAEMRFYAREGLVSAGLGWAIVSLVGCMPFFISVRSRHLLMHILRRFPALPQQEHPFLPMWRQCPMACSTGVVSLIGWAVWGLWSFFWRSFLPVARATALPCICFEQKVRDQMSANWCHVCARQRRSYIPCMWP